MRRVATVFFLLLVALAAAKRPRWHELEGYTFAQYVKDFGRGYQRGSEEYRMREAVFNGKLAVIREHNRNPTHSYRRGVNQFTDMTAEEWRRFNNLNFAAGQQAKPLRTVTAPAPDDTVALPLEVDYRQWSSPRVLTAVKHQGSCGNCWAHAAAEELESYFALLTGRLPVLSTQQITACTPATLNCLGCGGGHETMGWTYLNSTTHGETEEWAYPFSNFFFNISDPNAQTDACRNVTDMYPNKTPYNWFAELTRVGVSGFVRVATNDARSTMHALATTGPLAINVAAGNWQDYETGVFANMAQNGTVNEWQIDHAVQMVGYGFDREAGMGYWIVRNSWSTNWGEAGFIRLNRPDVEQCAPSTAVNFGTMVCGTSGCLSSPSYPVVTELTPTAF